MSSADDGTPFVDAALSTFAEKNASAFDMQRVLPGLKKDPILGNTEELTEGYRLHRGEREPGLATFDAAPTTSDVVGIARDYRGTESVDSAA